MLTCRHDRLAHIRDIDMGRSVRKANERPRHDARGDHEQNQEDEHRANASEHQLNGLRKKRFGRKCLRRE